MTPLRPRESSEGYEERTSGVRTTIELGQWVDEMCALMAETATEHLHKLGLKGTVVVNVEWTNDVKEGWMCIGSKIPPGASPLLAMSLRASADEIDGEEV